MAIPDEKPTPATADQIIRRVALGGGLATAVVFYLYQLLAHNSEQWTGLLKNWGPWFIPLLLGLYFLWDLLRLGVAHIGKLADGIQQISVSIALVAAKDDRQWEEMKLLTSYSSRQNDRAVELLEAYSKQMDSLFERQREMLDAVKGMPCKIGGYCPPGTPERSGDGK